MPILTTSPLHSWSAAIFQNNSRYAEQALLKLNASAQEFGCLFPKASAKEYMWQSLPTRDGVRVFPNGDLLARGRYDSTQALVNAIAVAMAAYKIPTAEEIKAANEKFRRDEQGKLLEQRRQIEKYWESIPPQAQVYVDDVVSGERMRMTMCNALPLLKSEEVRFSHLDHGWKQYAWLGFHL